MSVAVVGAGVVGLNTAAHIQQLLPHVKVTVIADKFTSDTTSDGAAGLFLPASNFKGPTPLSAKDWMKYSYNYYKNLMNENCGISEVTGYTLSSSNDESVVNQLMVGVSPEYRLATHEELMKFPGNWKQGTFMRTLVIQNRKFLPWLTERIKLKGAKVIKRKVNDFAELAGEYDVIVNCTGLQSRWLCADEQVVAIRGQVLKVKSPYNQFVILSRTYIIPTGDGTVTLGGTHQFDTWDPEVNPLDSQGIWERCTSVEPEIASAVRAWEWVGLRPFRETVRVESELKGNLKIVHNYGHGGYGVTSAPGTARDAAQLVKLLLETQAKL